MVLKQNEQAGIGIFAIIVIVAIIGLGGYATIKAIERAETDVEVDTEEEQAMMEESKDDLLSLKAEVNSTLRSIKADIEANAELAVSTSLEKIAELKAKIAELSRNGHESVKAETEALADVVEDISVKIETNTDDLIETIDQTIEEISLSASEELEFGNDEMTEDENATSTEDAMDDNSDENGVGASSNTDVNVDTDKLNSSSSLDVELN